MTSEDWLAEHKGEYLWTEGRVWECFDDDCNCTQAELVDVFKNKVLWRSDLKTVVRICVWEGEFRTDGESGADEELRQLRRQMRSTDPEREAAIRWDFEWPAGENVDS